MREAGSHREWARAREGLMWTQLGVSPMVTTSKCPDKTQPGDALPSVGFLA